MNLTILLLILLYEACGTAEQILFKKSANRFSKHQLRTIKDYLVFIAGILTIPFVWWGFLMTVLAWVIWLVILAKIDLSVAVPIDSIQYFIILAASYFFLKEKLHWTRLVGTILILLGVLVVAVS